MSKGARAYSLRLKPIPDLLLARQDDNRVNIFGRRRRYIDNDLPNSEYSLFGFRNRKGFRLTRATLWVYEMSIRYY
jgi:hypothetical protein